MSLDQIEEKCARVRCTDMFTEWRLCICECNDKPIIYKYNVTHKRTHSDT